MTHGCFLDLQHLKLMLIGTKFYKTPPPTTPLNFNGAKFQYLINQLHLKFDERVRIGDEWYVSGGQHQASGYLLEVRWIMVNPELTFS